MAWRQAQDISSLAYSIDRKISLGYHFYIFDIDCNREGSRLCFSAVNCKNTVFSKEPVVFKSPSGLYIALQEEAKERINYIYGKKDSVVKQHSDIHLMNPSILNRNFLGQSRFSTLTHQTPYHYSVLKETKEIWPENVEKSTTTGLPPKYQFIPQGIALSKTGGELICLWNKEIGKNSFGKVLKTNEDFEIFSDKNCPLYVCPTYIAENGNGDICVSDVRAVVVTDAGGMLRFRYQGNSSDSNFDPYGICCDSSCNIIVADMKNNKLHMIDKDGAFLYYVTYEGIRMPRALCIDENNHVYVGEWNTDVIKVIAR
uniref:Tripartite motif-containing protein 2 n=1 Tax=Magallana gigas TaxID=29159 RepID=A0A8W8NTS0_MAGGI